jgi:hypothetical protein
MEKIGRTVENVIKDLVAGVFEDIDELKKEPKDALNLGKMLAYFECLSRLQGEVMGYEELFGLDGDLEDKYGLTEYLNRQE